MELLAFLVELYLVTFWSSLAAVAHQITLLVAVAQVDLSIMEANH
jgi:hypothetical protein